MTRDFAPTPSNWGFIEVDKNQELSSLAEACQAGVSSGQVLDLPRAVEEVYRAWLRLSQDLDIPNQEASGELLMRWFHTIARDAGIDGDQLSETIRLGLASAQPFTTAELRERASAALPGETESWTDYLTAVTAIIRGALASSARSCALTGVGSRSMVSWKGRIDGGPVERPWIQFTPARSLKNSLIGHGSLAMSGDDDHLIRALFEAGYDAERALALSTALVRTVFVLLSEPRKALIIDGLGTLVRLDHGIRSGNNPKTGSEVVIRARKSVGFLPAAVLVS
jgi:nucleoid DNA-binding protein